MSTPMMNSITIDALIAEDVVVAQPIIDNPSRTLAIYEDVKAAAVAAATAVHRFIMPAIGEQAFVVEIKPPSTTGFIINSLLSFTQIKSQGKPEYPFVMYPELMKVSVTSLLIFGLASVAQHVISRTGFDPAASIYAGVARFVRIGSLFVMIASLAAPFYF